MNYRTYLKIFQNAAEQLDKDLLREKEFEVAVGEIHDSIFLKIYRISWTNSQTNPLTAESRIFFSIWINDSTIKENKLFYNIHAFRLRNLIGYKIQSRKFAELFRERFKNVESEWENVSVNFGPLTLKEGWKKINLEDFRSEIISLSYNFLKIGNLIDLNLDFFKDDK